MQGSTLGSNGLRRIWTVIAWATCGTALWAWSGPDQATWPQFRGADGSGVAVGEGLPERWSKSDNVLWSREIPGRGWSSPVVWGQRVFVTSAVQQGDFKEPWTGIYGNEYIAELRRQGLSQDEIMSRVRARDSEVPEESEEVRWMVYCLDAASGRILWERQAHRGLPFGGRHRKNTYASETPVTDGQRVYAYFGNVGLFAFSVEGEPLWQRKWAPGKIYLDFGTSSSPSLHGNRLFVLQDMQDGGFLAAIDVETGQQLWYQERSFEHPQIRSGFSTPFVWSNSKRTEVVTLGPQILISYDLQGNELWRQAGQSLVAAPTPIAQGDMLFSGSGSPSEPVRPLFAVRAGASGNISLAEKEKSSQYVAWSQPRGGSYITSPIVYGDRIYVLYDKGFLAAFDTASGDQLFKARFERGGHAFSSSPWAYQGKIFCLSEEGLTFVLQAADEYKVLAKNDLEEMSLATPAIAHGSLFIRTATRLYRIGEGGSRRGAEARREADEGERRE